MRPAIRRAMTRRRQEAAMDGAAPILRPARGPALLPASRGRRVVRLPGSVAAHESLQEAVLTYLSLHRVPAVPIHTGPRVRPREGGGFELRANRKQRGLSDVMACLPPDGRLALLELKTGTARRSPEQVAMQERFAKAGAHCAVIRDVLDLEPLVARRPVAAQSQEVAR